MKRQSIMVDAEGYIFVDGVKVARRIERDGMIYLQFLDKCRRRSAERGSTSAEIPAQDFDSIVLRGPIRELEY